MAAFKKGDIVFADNAEEKMVVTCVNGDEITCATNAVYRDTDLTLFERPGITTSRVEKEGVMDSSEYHVKDLHTRKTLGYGKIYEYDDQTWIVFRGKVYPVQYVGEEYTIYKNEEPWIAVNEEDEKDQQESDNC